MAIFLSSKRFNLSSNQVIQTSFPDFSTWYLISSKITFQLGFVLAID
jgi:hypothetical protein